MKIVLPCVLVVLAVGVVWCVSCLERDRILKQREAAPAVPAFAGTTTTVDEGLSSYYVKTIEHDGHKFVVSGRGGIIHHPSCP